MSLFSRSGTVLCEMIIFLTFITPYSVSIHTGSRSWPGPIIACTSISIVVIASGKLPFSRPVPASVITFIPVIISMPPLLFCLSKFLTLPLKLPLL